MNILVTGGLGKTAQPILDLLREAGHNVASFDICAGGDVRDCGAVNRAMRGMDAVIHLAVNTADTYNDRLTFETNVFGTYNVLHCAHSHNVQKTLIASSAPVHTAGGLCSPGEDFAYDLTKCLQEQIARQFSRTYAMDVMVLRLGHIVDGKRKINLDDGLPLSELSYCRGGWVCKYDVARAFAKAIEADFSGYYLLHVIGSYQAAASFDVSSAGALIGFACAERFLEY